MIRLKYALAMCAVIGLIACHQQQTEAKKKTDKPNIVWIVVEDMSPDLGCYGNKVLKTPNMDELASIGHKYTRAYATAPVCMPSRTALITGHHQGSIGAYHMRYPDKFKPSLPEGVLPIHENIKKAGYKTYNIKTKPSNGKTDWAFDYDKKSFDGYYWNQVENEQPFFAISCIYLTHRPFVKDTISPVNASLIDIPPYYPDHQVTREDYKGYYETIQVLDRKVGKVIQQMRKNNLLDNTLIFFMSDHGRPMPRDKNYLYETGLNVPFIVTSFDPKVRDKYLKGENVKDRLVSLIDVTATTDEILTGENHTQGMNIFDTKSERSLVYAGSNRIGGSEFRTRSIRDDQYHYIRYYKNDYTINGSASAYRKYMHPMYHLINMLGDRGELDTHQKRLLEPLQPEELYKVGEDPYELKNLASDPAYETVLNTMRTKLDSSAEAMNDRGVFDQDSQEMIDIFNGYKKKSHEDNADKINLLKAEVESKL